MVTTGAEPQKEMFEIQMDQAAGTGGKGIIGLMADKTKHSDTGSLVREKMREAYNHHMADMVSDFYKGGQEYDK